MPIIFAYKIQKKSEVGVCQSVLLSLFSMILSFIVYCVPCIWNVLKYGISSQNHLIAYHYTPPLLFGITFLIFLIIFMVVNKRRKVKF